MEINHSFDSYKEEEIRLGEKALKGELLNDYFNPFPINKNAKCTSQGFINYIKSGLDGNANSYQLRRGKLPKNFTNDNLSELENSDIDRIYIETTHKTPNENELRILFSVFPTIDYLKECVHRLLNHNLFEMAMAVQKIVIEMEILDFSIANSRSYSFDITDRIQKIYAQPFNEMPGRLLEVKNGQITLEKFLNKHAFPKSIEIPKLNGFYYGGGYISTEDIFNNGSVIINAGQPFIVIGSDLVDIDEDPLDNGGYPCIRDNYILLKFDTCRYDLRTICSLYDKGILNQNDINSMFGTGFYLYQALKEHLLAHENPTLNVALTNEQVEAFNLFFSDKSKLKYATKKPHKDIVVLDEYNYDYKKSYFEPFKFLNLFEELTEIQKDGFEEALKAHQLYKYGIPIVYRPPYQTDRSGFNRSYPIYYVSNIRRTEEKEKDENQFFASKYVVHEELNYVLYDRITHPSLVLSNSCFKSIQREVLQFLEISNKKNDYYDLLIRLTEEVTSDIGSDKHFEFYLYKLDVLLWLKLVYYNQLEFNAPNQIRQLVLRINYEIEKCLLFLPDSHYANQSNDYYPGGSIDKADKLFCLFMKLSTYIENEVEDKNAQIAFNRYVLQKSSYFIHKEPRNLLEESHFIQIGKYLLHDETLSNLVKEIEMIDENVNHAGHKICGLERFLLDIIKIITKVEQEPESAYNSKIVDLFKFRECFTNKFTTPSYVVVNVTSKLILEHCGLNVTLLESASRQIERQLVKGIIW